LSEIKWATNLLLELCVPSSTPKIYTDNLGAFLIAKNHIMHYKTKHFYLDPHFVQDSLQQKQLKLTNILSTLQIANVLSKQLSGSSLQLFKIKLVVPKLTINLQGGVCNITYLEAYVCISPLIWSPYKPVR